MEPPSLTRKKNFFFHFKLNFFFFLNRDGLKPMVKLFPNLEQLFFAGRIFFFFFFFIKLKKYFFSLKAKKSFVTINFGDLKNFQKLKVLQIGQSELEFSKLEDFNVSSLETLFWNGESIGDKPEVPYKIIECSIPFDTAFSNLQYSKPFIVISFSFFLSLC